LPPNERGWITFADPRSLFSAERAEYAFGELDQSGREKIEAFAAQHWAVISFIPLEARIYFARDRNAANVRLTPESGHGSARL
jgi:hypothetical protein